jgi:hypothetical protein
MIETGTVLHERFLIEEQIGVGGMGAVHRAIDQKFGSTVAIKETFYHDPELAEAFEREARLLNGLHHPIFPHVSDHFTENGGHFLVMEYIEGEDLSELIKRGERFAFDSVMSWTLDLLDGLDYLHSQDPPIIHRDIKPSNLKLTSRGNIILLDFGMAKETSGNTQGMRSVFGYSRKYSPLEQIEGTGTDVRSDIFSLGATVFHLLTGTPPTDVLRRASAIVAGRPDPLELASTINEDVPEPLALIINSALALNPEERFVSARAMWNALEHSLTGRQSENATSVAIPAPPAPVFEPPAEGSFPALKAFEAEVEADIGDSPAATVFRSFTEDEDDQAAALVAQREAQIKTADNTETRAEEKDQTDRIIVPVYHADAVKQDGIQDLGAADEPRPGDALEPAIEERRTPFAAHYSYPIFLGIPLLLLILGLAGYALFRNSSSEVTLEDAPTQESELSANEPDASVEPDASESSPEAPAPVENVTTGESTATLEDIEQLRAESSNAAKRSEVLDPAEQRKAASVSERTSDGGTLGAKERIDEPTRRVRNEAPTNSRAKPAARPRVIQDGIDERPTVSSIESIMTGIPTNRPVRQQRRWEVWEEDQLRRERRQRRIDRRNRQNWPLF